MREKCVYSRKQDKEPIIAQVIRKEIKKLKKKADSVWCARFVKIMFMAMQVAAKPRYSIPKIPVVE